MEVHVQLGQSVKISNLDGLSLLLDETFQVFEVVWPEFSLIQDDFACQAFQGGAEREDFLDIFVIQGLDKAAQIGDIVLLSTQNLKFRGIRANISGRLVKVSLLGHQARSRAGAVRCP